MADALMPYLEKLLADIEKDVARFEEKSEAAMFLKPVAEFTEADWKRFERTSTDRMMAEHRKWMQRRIDAESAASELRNVIFLRGLTYGR